METRLIDSVWIWGQDAGSHHAASANKSWKLPGVNKMGPAEGAEYMGISNMCRVVMGGRPEPPFDAESEKLSGIDRVVWSAIGDAGSVRNNHKTDLEDLLSQARRHTNITGAILDDFFLNPEGGKGKLARAGLEEIKSMREKLHGFSSRKLDLWVVWYKKGLDSPVADYLEQFDVITYWNMRAPAEERELEGDFEKLVRKTPGKRRMTGCYMWNYGEGKPLSVPEIRTQCEKYTRWMREGLSEGIIFCSNCCADLGLEAVEWVREWLGENGSLAIKDVRA